MKRRQVLRAGSVGLAGVVGGCTGLSLDSVVGDNASESYRLSTRDVPARRPVTHEATLVQADIHDETEPLTIRISITNEGDSVLRYGPDDPVLGRYLDDGDCILVPPNTTPHEFDSESGLWVATDGVDFAAVASPDQIHPGMQITQELQLLVSSLREPLDSPPEAFAFDVQFSFAADRQSAMETFDEEWGFTIQRD